MTQDLSQGSVAHTLYKLTAPMVLGILAVFLFNLVDMFFIGLLGTQPLAAVSFTFPVTMVVMNLAIGLSIGAGAVVARAAGQKNIKEIQNWVMAALSLAVVLGITLAALLILFQNSVYQLLGAEEALIPLIKEYLTPWLLGSVSIMVLITVNASVRATGNTKLPSIMMLISAVINGALDPLLIFGLGPIPAMGLFGAALATIISWIVALAFIMRRMIKDEILVFEWPEQIKPLWKKLLALGIPAAITNLLVPLANGILIAFVARFGTDAVAAYGVGMRLEPMAMIVVLALSASLAPFVGQNLGAGKPERIQQGLWKSLQFITVWQLVIYALMALNASTLSGLFSDQDSVRQWIELFLYILPATYMGAGYVLITNATLNALHRPRISLLLSAMRLFIFYVPSAYIGQLFWGMEGLLIGSAIGNILVGLATLSLIRFAETQSRWQARLMAT